MTCTATTSALPNDGLPPLSWLKPPKKIHPSGRAIVYRLFWLTASGMFLAMGYAPHEQPTLAWLGLTMAIHAFARTRNSFDALISGAVMGMVWVGTSLKWLYAGVERSHHFLLGIAAPTAAVALMLILPMVMSLAAHHSHGTNLPLWLLLTPTATFLFEYLRYIGPMPFPWLGLGYTQIPDGLFAGAVPWVGVIGLAWLMPFCSCLLLAWLRTRQSGRALAALLAMALTGLALQTLEFTQASGHALSVALLPGLQSSPLPAPLRAPPSAADIVSHSLGQTAVTDATLIVLREGAWPLFQHQLPPPLMTELASSLAARGQDLVTGHLMRHGDDPSRYHNVAHAIGASGDQFHIKRQRVPFGEYIPFDVWLRPLYQRIAKVNLLDTSPGPDVQDSVVLGGHRAAIRLCFEDLFGHLFLDEVREAGLILAMTNDDWFDVSQPIHQHLQIAQARALEARKPLLRVGPGAGTAVIDHFGHITERPDAQSSGIVKAQVQPRTGTTPFSRYGLLSVLLMIVLVSSLCLLLAPRRASQPTVGRFAS